MRMIRTLIEGICVFYDLEIYTHRWTNINDKLVLAIIVEYFCKMLGNFIDKL